MEIRPLEPRDQPGLQTFLRGIPEGDKTFFKEPIDDEAHVACWFDPPGARLGTLFSFLEVWLRGRRCPAPKEAECFR